MTNLLFRLTLFLMCLFSSSLAVAEEAAQTAVEAAETVIEAPPVQVGDILVLHDFTGENLTSNIGSESGSWNMDPTDINDSWCDEEKVEMEGPDGNMTTALKLHYNVDSPKPSQNGFWIKLDNLNAVEYDHIEFVVKGDVEKGFTEVFKMEIKKCKEPPCTGDPVTDAVIKGSYRVPVTSEWTTVSIPLNRITGIINFYDPAAWQNPAVARKDLDELVIVFHDRMVTKLNGVIYIDEIRLKKTGNPGPTAVDFPKQTREKTETKIEGLDFARFLVKRLGGYPEVSTVKKDFPEDDREFLMEVARDTWKFFDDIVDQEFGLPLDTIQLGVNEPIEDGAWVGDYTNVTNIGVYLMCLAAGYDFGFITKEDAIARVQKTLNTMENVLEHHESGFPYNYYDTTLGTRTSYFVSLVDSGWLVAGYYVVKQAFPEVAEQAQRLIERGSFEFLYDDVERQFFHGFYEHLDVYSDYHYGAFYTEPRATSYIGIAQGEVPMEHWFKGLIRTFPDSYAWQNQSPKMRYPKEALGMLFYSGYYEWEGMKYIPSWGGSAFEALMPTMVLMEKELAPEGLGLNNDIHVQGQIKYAMEKEGYPVWGMSPSSVPEGGYSEYGAKPFGAKGYKSGAVTPHASALAVEYAPKEVVANMRKMIELYDIYGEYGFYDAVNPETGLVTKKYLALDQGMLFVALCNYLNDGSIRKYFHSDPKMKEIEKLLTSEKFFEEVEPNERIVK